MGDEGLFLTDEEKRMLEGDHGYPVKKAMQILVALGESFGADRMVEVSSCHLPGASITALGEAGLRFVEEMAERGGKFRVFTTTNPTACDLHLWKSLDIDEAIVDQQIRLNRAYEKLGAVTCSSCTPYFIGNAPRAGETVAWGESSAVAYANSVLGAWTNREGGPSALSASITGRVPAYGMNLKENRFGKIVVHVSTALSGVSDYSTLGYFVGSIAKQDIPVFTGIPPGVTFDELKLLGSALATSGAVPLYHIVGVTPEAPTLQDALGEKKPELTVEYGKNNQKEAEEHLNTSPSSRADWVYIGCPHCSIVEVGTIAKALEGKKIHRDVEMWICTSDCVKALAEQTGYASTIKKAGARIVCQTCLAHAPSKIMALKKGYSTITTDSAKMAHYAASEVGLSTHYGSTENVIEASITNKWG